MKKILTKNNEGNLLNVINEYSEIVWWRFGGRFKTTLNLNNEKVVNLSFRPPCFSFRFKDEDGFFIEKLRVIIQEYNCGEAWLLNSRKRDGLPGTNYVILPARVKGFKNDACRENMNVFDYCEKYYPELSNSEFDDVPKFTKWVEEKLRVSVNMN